MFKVLIAFIATYAAVIIAGIGVVASQLYSNPKKPGNDPPPHKQPLSVSKIVLIGLVLSVIVACFVNFIDKPIDKSIDKSINKSIDKSKVRELLPEEYSSVEASSTYSGDRATHITSNLTDKDPKTNWTEGVLGNGEGESVVFHCLEQHSFVGFTIRAGNHFDDSYYENNARPKTITLSFSDGSAIEFTLQDEKEKQIFYFDQPVDAKSVCLTITSVYAGKKWEDTVISDITFLELVS